MRAILFSLLFSFWFLPHTCHAQNLVPNPSFEEYTSCPDDLDQVYKATGWISVRTSPDYFNSCSPDIGTFTNVSVPHNFWGWQMPSSGNAYMGFAAMYGPENVREYIAISLSDTLKIGVKYFVSFKVNLSYKENSLACAVNNLGMLLSTHPYSMTNPAPICNCAQLYTDSIISDTLNWTQLLFSFTVDSAYSFIAIGNFFADSLTNRVQFQGPLCDAYYYLDDVCISTDSLYCNAFTYTSLEREDNSELIRIYPNPFTDIVRVDGLSSEINEIYLYDFLGQLIGRYPHNNSGILKLSLSYLPKGVYMLSLSTFSGNTLNKIITKL